MKDVFCHEVRYFRHRRLQDRRQVFYLPEQCLRFLRFLSQVQAPDRLKVQNCSFPVYLLFAQVPCEEQDDGVRRVQE